MQGAFKHSERTATKLAFKEQALLFIYLFLLHIESRTCNAESNICSEINIMSYVVERDKGGGALGIEDRIEEHARQRGRPRGGASNRRAGRRASVSRRRFFAVASSCLCRLLSRRLPACRHVVPILLVMSPTKKK